MTSKPLRSARSDVIAAAHTRVWASLVGVLGFALLTAVAARLALPVPGTPVPITLQTLFVLLAGATLGPRLGTASMAFYLVLGTVGYHVFALGNWGLATVFAATGGYLMGFLLAQPIIGQMARPGPRHWRRVLAGMLLGNAVIYAAGLTWLALWAGTSLWATLNLGLWPFLPFELPKIVLAAGIGGLAAPHVRRILTA
jgi:biotin transport system substrate-specific component